MVSAHKKNFSSLWGEVDTYTDNIHIIHRC